MNTTAAAITAPNIAYLGPRLDAVNVLVTAADASALKSAWPEAQQALFLQGVDLHTVKSPAAKMTSRDFKKFVTSIRRWAEPTFSQTVNGIVDVEPCERSIAVQVELLELGALQTYAANGLLDHMVVERFQALDLHDGAVITRGFGKRFQGSTPLSTDDSSLPRKLMRDLSMLNSYLENPLNSLSFADLEKIIYAHSSKTRARKLLSYIRDDLNNYRAFPLTQAELPQKKSKAVERRRQLTGVGCRTNEIIWHRVMIIEAIRPAIEGRVMHAVLGGTGEYTTNDITNIYRWGFLSPQVYEAIGG